MSHHRVVISALMYGQLVQNVLHFINNGGAFTPQQICADVKLNWVDKVSVFQNAQLRYFNILCQNLDDQVLAPFSLTIDRQGQGFDDRRIPSTLGYVLKYTTNRAGRHGRGRSILGGVQSDSIQDGRLTPSALVSWTDTVISHLKLSYVDDINNTLVLCVREQSGQMNPLIDIQMRAVVGTMRRRQIGVGV
jgi:hypothetical protein